LSEGGPEYLRLGGLGIVHKDDYLPFAKDYLAYLDTRKEYEELTGEPAPFANGGAFTNGIVSTPTSFNMGLMGEAGPEAIMPLTNVGGQMGVKAILPESSPTLDYSLASAISDLKNEIKDVKSELNQLRKENNEKQSESNAIDREGYLALIARLQQSNELLSDMEETSTLNRSRD